VKKNLFGMRDVRSLNTSSNTGSIHRYPSFDKFSLFAEESMWVRRWLFEAKNICLRGLPFAD
jgi:hypothetical protein